MSMLRRTFETAQLVLIAGLIACIMWIAVNVIVPPIEVRLLPPVARLTFESSKCLGDDLVAHVRLDKASYPGGAYATYLGLTLRLEDSTGEEIRWFPYWGADAPLENPNNPNRPPGEQEFDLLLVGACSKTFRAFTEHRSPFTHLRLKMTFGPFNAGSQASSSESRAK